MWDFSFAWTEQPFQKQKAAWSWSKCLSILRWEEEEYIEHFIFQSFLFLKETKKMEEKKKDRNNVGEPRWYPMSACCLAYGK